MSPATWGEKAAQNVILLCTADLLTTMMSSLMFLQRMAKSTSAIAPKLWEREGKGR